MDGSLLLSSLKNQKENFAAHEVLTWKLKNRINLINHGNANTNFFQIVASSRNNFNAIRVLKKEFGVLVSDGAQLKSMGGDLFSSLLKYDGNSLISNN